MKKQFSLKHVLAAVAVIGLVLFGTALDRRVAHINNDVQHIQEVVVNDSVESMNHVMATVDIAEALMHVSAPVELTYKANYDSTITEESVWNDQKSGASLFRITQDHYLASTHAMVAPESTFYSTPFGPMPMKQNVKDEKIMVNGEYEAKVVATVHDLTVLYCPEAYKLGLSIMPWALDPQLGEKLYFMGNSYLTSLNFKTGHVSVIDVTKNLAVVPEANSLIKPEFDVGVKSMLVTVPLNMGDSGSPAFVLRDGQLYVVGIAAAKVARGAVHMSFMWRMDFVLDSLAPFLIDLTEVI